MNEFIEPRALTPVTAYSKAIADGIVRILKEYCFKDKARTDGELDDAIRLFLLDAAYGAGVDIDVNEVVDSIYEQVDDFMIKFNNNKK